jgi:hypothetical protein
MDSDQKRHFKIQNLSVDTNAKLADGFNFTTNNSSFLPSLAESIYLVRLIFP